MNQNIGKDPPPTMQANKRWQVSPRAPEKRLSLLLREFAQMPRPVAQILFNRDLATPEKADRFMVRAWEDDNPFGLKGMHDAVTRLRQSIRDSERVAVYGDFDADGVTSTALLVDTLRGFGIDVRPYIPHRTEEGYGLRVEALEELAKQGVRLVVTVDCGIRAVDEIRHAKDLGLEVIVTDHHSVGPLLPPALAIINPKQEDCRYAFKELAGVGIAFKLAQALLRANAKVRIQEIRLVEDDLLDLVAVGTVADLAPLIGENRVLVQRGLVKINEGQRPGLLALIQNSGLQLGEVDAAAIGFGLGPRINAAGRLADANMALQLLVAQFPGEADKLANELDGLNRERQRIAAETREQARQQAMAQGSDVPLLFAASPGFLEGVVGLAAGGLCEEFYRPAIVASIGAATTRGSARSIPEFHITEALDQCSGLLVRHGGHAAAAGFTVRNEDLPLLAERLQALATDALADTILKPTIVIDVEIRLGELNRRLYDWLTRLEPFGYANPVPVFMTRRVRVVSRQTFGADRSHLSLTLGDGRVRWKAVAFQRGSWWDQIPDFIDVVYQFELNRWNGREQLRLNVRDLRPAQLQG